MNNLFTTTDYDYVIGKTIREEFLNNEDLYIDMELEDLEKSREHIINQINSFLIWYYLTCDAIKNKEKEDKKGYIR